MLSRKNFSSIDYSRRSVLLLCGLLFFWSLKQLREEGPEGYRHTDWDALGYYLYAPAITIHHDLKKLDWYEREEQRYHLQGSGGFYQFSALPGGNRVGKYFVGVSVMQYPFFLLAHASAGALGYARDGFSFPYQLAVLLASLTYAIMAIGLMRKVLLRYFDQGTSAWVLLLVFAASNFLQYAAVDCGQVHIYGLFWYALMLYVTPHFFARPCAKTALAIGFIAGMATLCRPTEAIIIFIPLLWGAGRHSFGWQRRKVLIHRWHWLLFAFIGGLIGIAPQLLYWHHVSGSWVYDVGSKWDFLKPHLKVLWGWEKDWFIYTPVTVLFVLGLFCMRRYPFRRSVLVFMILNIWIVTAWSDWLYGGSYAARALVQCLPVCCLSLGALWYRFGQNSLVLRVSGIYLICINMLQLAQYNTNVIDYRANNRNYYSAVYGSIHPDPLAYSLLEDNEPFPAAARIVLWMADTTRRTVNGDQQIKLWKGKPVLAYVRGYRVCFRIRSESETGGQHILIQPQFAGVSFPVRKLRLKQPLHSSGDWIDYAVFIPAASAFDELLLQTDDAQYHGVLDSLHIDLVR
ncbi:MAG: hypothetical protein QM743_13505 [Chitinophagaceae bacterium]